MTEPRWKKQTKIIWYSVFTVLIAVMVIGMLLYQDRMVRNAQERAYQTLIDSAGDQVHTLNATLENQFALLESYAALVEKQGLSFGEVQQQLSVIVENSYFSYMIYADSTGRALSNDGRFTVIADRYYFQQALSGNVALERIGKGRIDQKSHVDLAVPVYSGGKISGVLSGIYSEKSFQNLIVSNAFNGNSYSLLCDSVGNIIVNSDQSGSLSGQSNVLSVLKDAAFTHGSYSECRQALESGDSGIVSYSMDGQARYAAYQPIGINGWMIFSIVPSAVVQTEIESTLQSGFLVIAFTIILCLCFILFISLLVRRQNRQLEQEKEQLRLSDERFHIALSNSSVTIWDYDFATRSILQTTHSIQQHGFEKTVEDVPEGLIACGYVSPESVEAFRDMYRRLLSGEEKVEGVFRVQNASRTGYWYEHVRYTALKDVNGVFYRAIGMSEDVTERYEAQQAYQRELTYRQTENGNLLTRVLLNITCDQLVECESKNLNQMKELPKLALRDFFLNAAGEVVSDDGIRNYFNSLTPQMIRQSYEEGKTVISFNYLCRFCDGSEGWVSYESHLLLDPSTGDLMDFLYLRNIDAQKRKLDALSRAAEQDSMTGVYNHQSTLQYIDRFLVMEGRIGRHALFMVDVDNFKSVNDTLGHQSGDSAIQKIAEILQRLFRETDIIGRIGGDEFLILMKNVPTMELVRKKAQELVSALQFVCSSAEGCLSLSGSVGVGLYQHGDTVDTLYAKADSAMYAAKNAGKNQYALCDETGKAILTAVGEKHGNDGETIQLQTLLEHIDGGVLLMEVGEKIDITYVSPSFRRLVRTADRDATNLGKVIRAQIFEQDFDELSKVVHEAALSGQVREHIFRVHTDHGIGWHHARMIRLPDDGRDMPVLIGVVSDITAYKKSTAQLEAIVSHSPVGIAVFTIGEKIEPQFLNQAFLQIVGCPREEFDRLCEGDASRLIFPQDRARVMAELEAALLENRPTEFSYRSHTASPDRDLFLSVRCVRLEESEGHPTVLAIFSDITQEKQAEMQINMLRETYQIAMEQTGATLWKVDLPSHTLYTTRADLGSDGRLEKTISDIPEGLITSGIIHQKSQGEIRRMFQNLYAGNDSEEYLIILLIDGQPLWHRCRFCLLDDENGSKNYAVGITAPAPNIDAEMLKFQQEQGFLNGIQNSLLEYFHVNLTRDKVVAAKYDETTALGAAVDTYSALFARCFNFVAMEEDRKVVLKKSSPRYLHDYFRSGSDWLFLEFRRKTADGHIRWTAESIRLLRHPISGDLFAFFYLRDIDSKYRWELAIPCKPERDSSTFLFTRETAEAMVDYILRSRRDSHSLCALCVLELVNLTHVKTEHGIAASNRALFTIGRLLRVMVDGQSVAARLDETHLFIFRTDVESPKSYEKRVTDLIHQIFNAQEGALIDEPVELVSGIAIEEFSEAEFGSLLQRAVSACEEAVKKSAHPVTIYNGSEQERLPAARQLPAPPPQAQESPEPLTRKEFYNTLLNLSPDALSTLGVFCAYVNDLAELNQSCGMPFGDAMLRFISETLISTFGPEYVYRLSEDEFLVLAPDLTEDAFSGLCSRVTEHIDSSYSNILSCGTAWDNHISSVQSLVDHASELMHLAKEESCRTAKDTALHPSYHSGAACWLQKSLREHLFHVYLQPKANVATREVACCEALIRYCDAEHGTVMPIQFIPILEREGLIQKLDLFVLEEAIGILSRWKREGRKLYPIAVNFSRRTLLHPATFEIVKKLLLPDAQLKPYLEIEVTETIGSIDRATIVKACEQYRSEGFKLGLDDFGSNYSSLQILTVQLFDTIKIDKSIINDLVTNEISRLVVESTLAIARQEHGVLVAEGVETEEQLAVLRQIGCDLAQGYLFNKPLPIEEFEKLYQKE